MKSNFKDCLQRVLKDEGGYSNVKGDNGGPTNYGITIADVRKYVKADATASDVKNLSLDQAGSIYKERYWDVLGCDSLPSGVDYTCFDYGVNSGVGRPRAALAKFKSKTGVDLINAINDDRTRFLNSIGTGHNAQFLRGWLARVARVRTHSLELAKAPSASAKASAGMFAGLFTGLASAYHWGIQHWPYVLGATAAAAILGYLIIHYTKKK